MATNKKTDKATIAGRRRGLAKSRTAKIAQQAEQLQEAEKRLSDLVNSLEGRVESLLVSKASDREIAFQALGIVRCLVRSEIPGDTLEVALAKFIERFWGEGLIHSLALNLYRQIRRAAFGDQLGEHSCQISLEEMARSLIEIIDWYHKRKQSFLQIQLLGDLVDQEVMIFDLAVSNDREYAGVQGFEVSCGLLVVGMPRETVWLKVLIRNKKKFVTTRAGWESWGGSAQSFLLTDLSHNSRVAALLPLECKTQRLLVDSVSAFIPYAALQLPAGQAEISVEVQLSDGRGHELIGASSQQIIHLAAGLDSDYPLPSPHALGYWQKDFVRGNSIDNLRVELVQAAEDTKQDDLVVVSCDVTVSDQVGSLLYLEYRFLDWQGDLVKTAEESVSDQRGAFVCGQQLQPAELIQHYYGLEAEIPVAVLKAPLESSRLLCQVTVTSAAGEVLCGSIYPVQLYF